jgi:hypothetical protein
MTPLRARKSFDSLRDNLVHNLIAIFFNSYSDSLDL